MRLQLPGRGDFDLEQIARNFRHIELWANQARDTLMLVDHDELPPAEYWPEHSICVTQGVFYRNVAQETWEPLLPVDSGYRLTATWSKQGALAAGVRPHKWPSPVGGSIEEVTGTLGTVGTTDTVIDLLVNGASVLGGTLLTIPAGLSQPRTPLRMRKPLIKKDELQVQIVTVGTGAKDLTVEAFILPGVNALADRVEVPGPQGIPGTNGINGTNGTNGLGVPAGGATGTVLTKVSAADNDTAWQAPAGGAGVSRVSFIDSCDAAALPTGFSSTGQLTYSATKYRRELGGTSASSYDTPAMTSDESPWWDINVSLLNAVNAGTLRCEIYRAGTPTLLCWLGIQGDGNLVMYDNPPGVLYASGGGQIPRYEIYNWRIGFDVERNIFWWRIARDGGNALVTSGGRQPPSQGIAAGQNLYMHLVTDGTQKVGIFRVVGSRGIPVFE